jgi:hypothetical protein
LGFRKEHFATHDSLFFVYFFLSFFLSYPIKWHLIEILRSRITWIWLPVDSSQLTGQYSINPLRTYEVYRNIIPTVGSISYTVNVISCNRLTHPSCKINSYIWTTQASKKKKSWKQLSKLIQWFSFSNYGQSKKYYKIFVRNTSLHFHYIFTFIL